MKPAHVELGQLWEQTISSRNTRWYVVVRVYDTDDGFAVATILDLERGSQRTLDTHGMLSWDSWRPFEP